MWNLNMITAVVSEYIDAPADRVRSLYDDPANWGTLFPLTIRRARVLRRVDNVLHVEVDHIGGKVLNILRHVSPTCIELTEFKRRFDATFLNEFLPEKQGTRYRLTAFVRVKLPYRLLTPFLKPLVVARMKRYVVEALKAAAERARSANPAA